MGGKREGEVAERPRVTQHEHVNDSIIVRVPL